MKKQYLLLLRILLGILIVANMAIIFAFSSQNYEKSSQTSNTVITGIISADRIPEKEQERIDFMLSRRKIAHMLEFGSLGALTYLFLLTWKRGMYLKYLASILFTTIYAASDEIHQLFVDGRSGLAADVFVDASGALISCTVILAVCFLFRHESQPIKTTVYTLPAPVEDMKGMTLAVAADLHGNDPTLPLQALAAASPDLILIPGDLMDDKMLCDPNHSGYAFLRACADMAPTYYSLGNHEIACYHKGNPWRHPTPIPVPPEAKERIAQTGAILLDNEMVTAKGLTICGLTSGINKAENRPHAEVLQKFAEADGARLLLCHHPEYFVPYIRETDIELTVSGHAHGGQWRFFGRGVYSPGQGILPKYTAGVLDGRCVISRGMGNHTRIPRICNQPELVIVKLV